MELQAYQHIYANVEQEQSPKKRGGFQTLFVTPGGLSEREVEEIEARVLYYPSATAPIKQLFFVTQAGHAVVGQAVPLPEPDSAGRGGRYLAHCLIFPPEAFARCGGDPLRILEHAPFLTTVDDALARGDMATGAIPPLTLTLPDAGASEAPLAEWSREARRRLVMAGLHAARLAGARKMLAIIGSPEETRAVLRAAMLAVPTAHRSACTFDTYFYRCNPVATYCWAVGLPDVPANPNYLAVSCAARTVDDPELPDPASCYERWVAAALDHQALGVVAGARDEAWRLCGWLDGEPAEPDTLRAIAAPVLGSVFSTSATQVHAALRRRLAQTVGGALADRLLPALQQREPGEVLALLLDPLELPPLLEALYQRYAAQGFARPAAGELAALGALLAKADHVGLRIWHTYWTGTPEEARALLTRLPDDHFRTFLTCALVAPGVDLARLILPGKGRLLVDGLLAARRMEYVNLAMLAQALVDNGAADLLDRLTSHVAQRPPEELRALQLLVKQAPEIPEPFQLEVERAAGDLPQPRGVGGLFQRLFGKDR
ncbi:MAG TPA: hypothetical protein PK794_09030 [Armatimonadota bacterium]|nr:hypothetical protein [Armatimonadota bacterium]